jgi:hypothetical protein
VRTILQTAALSGLLLTTPHTAQADWQYTKWGMTVDQVIEASNGKAAPPVKPQVIANFDSKLDHRLDVPHEAVGYPMVAHLYFRQQDKTLAMVTMDSRDREVCQRLPALLSSRFGETVPPKDDSGDYQRFRSTEENVAVLYSRLTPQLCKIQYQPILTAASGL